MKTDLLFLWLDFSIKFSYKKEGDKKVLINDRCEACLYNKQKIGAANIENPEPLLKKTREHLKKYRDMKSAPWLIFELNEMA